MKDSMTGDMSKNLLIPPLAGGIITSVFVFFSVEHGVPALVVAGVVMLMAVLTGLWARREYKRLIEPQITDSREMVSNNNSFCLRLYPVWSKQINSAKNMGDDAVSNLTRTFSDIVRKLGSILEISKSTVSQGGEAASFVSVIDKSKQDFKKVINEFKTVMESVRENREMMFAEINAYATDLKVMAEEAKLAAVQSKMIALNAQIEAVSSGKDGLAFSAVVVEMRAQASRAAETSARMAKKVEEIDNALSMLSAEVQNSSGAEKAKILEAESTFSEVVDRFNAITDNLSRSIQNMENESVQVRNGVSNALIALQFQDSVSQVLDHVAENIDELNEKIKMGSRKYNTDAWIGEMIETSSVDVELENLNEKKHSDDTSHGVTTFF